MTQRLYASDAYRCQFEARVVEELTWDGHPAVVLDQSGFYPESGGQPGDRGTLGDTRVIDVVEREGDGAVIHVLSDPVPGRHVEGKVDWQRRFDHMQQHTGQHILSAALEERLQAGTVGFHLGTLSSTIDLDVTGLTMEEVTGAETLANEVVWGDREIAIELADRGTLATYDVEPPGDITGPIRLLIIPGPPGRGKSPPFDVNPCGGTHVARTGEVGTIKIVDLERRGSETRVTFVCGARALRDYREKHDTLTALTSRMTVGYWELDGAIQRLQDESRELFRTQRELRQELLDLQARQLLTTAETQGRYAVVGQVWRDRSADDLRILARKLVDYSAVVALLFSVDDRTHYCFARAEALDLNVNELLQQACRRLGGKGGGRPDVAQGSAPATPLSDVKDLLDELLTELERA